MRMNITSVALMWLLAAQLAQADDPINVSKTGTVLSDEVLYSIGGGSAVSMGSAGQMDSIGVGFGWNNDMMCGNMNLSTTLENQLNGATQGFQNIMGSVIQNATGAVMSLPALIDLFREAGGQGHLQRPALGHDPLHQLAAVHPWHRLVGQEDVQFRRRRENLQGQAAGVGLEYRATEVLQHRRGVVQHQRVVVHHQYSTGQAHPLAFAGRLRRRAIARTGAFRGSRDGGYPDVRGGADARLALQGEPAAELLGEAVDDRSLPVSLLVCRAFCTLAGRVALTWARVGRAKGRSVAKARVRSDLNINEEPLKTEGRK